MPRIPIPHSFQVFFLVVAIFLSYDLLLCWRYIPFPTFSEDARDLLAASRAAFLAVLAIANLCFLYHIWS